MRESIGQGDEVDIVTASDPQRVLQRDEIFSILDVGNIDMKVYTVYATLREQRFHVYRHGCWEVKDKSLVRLQTLGRVLRAAHSFIDARRPGEKSSRAESRARGIGESGFRLLP